MLTEAFRLFISKNRQYGNSIEETGVLGAVVECHQKVARLREMVLRHPQGGAQAPEEVRQNVIDLLNYAAITVMMLDAGNWRGEEKDDA